VVGDDALGERLLPPSDAGGIRAFGQERSHHIGRRRPHLRGHGQFIRRGHRGQLLDGIGRDWRGGGGWRNAGFGGGGRRLRSDSHLRGDCHFGGRVGTGGEKRGKNQKPGDHLFHGLSFLGCGDYTTCPECATPVTARRTTRAVCSAIRFRRIIRITTETN